MSKSKRNKEFKIDVNQPKSLTAKKLKEILNKLPNKKEVEIEVYRAGEPYFVKSMSYLDYESKGYLSVHLL